MKKPINKIDIFITICIVLLFLFFSLKTYGPFEALERFFYNAEMRLDLPTISLENKIAIVNIDAKSLQQLGPWPWPRHVIGDMIRILKNNGAKLIGLDLLLPHRSQNEGLDAVRGLYDLIYRLQRQDQGNASYDILLKRVAEIENQLDEDKELAWAIKQAGNIVLPVVGTFGRYDTELVLSPDAPLARSLVNSPNLQKKMKEHISVNRLITPFPELSNSCRWLGHINFPPKEEKAGQVHLPFIDYRGNIIPSMPLVMAFDYLKKDPRRVIIRKNAITVAQEAIPTRNGEMFIKFRGARRSFPYYSFVDILKVKKVPAVFDGKIVLIGFTAGDNRTAIDTPVDPEMPRVELAANIINDLLKGRYLRRPTAMLFLEAFLLILLATAAFLFIPRLSYLGRTAFTMSLLFLLFVTSIVLFVATDSWFKITYISLSLLSIYAFFMVRDFVVRERSMERTSKESIETNRMLGLSFQSQGLLDLAFEKFRKCPLDDAMKDVLYNLGLDFERKRMVNKAISVYEYINQGEKDFRDLSSRIPKLRKIAGELPVSGFKGKKEAKILFSEDLETKPTVGRYEILDELGQGAMGMVYKARDPKINRLVAIKTIRFSDEFEDDRISEVKERFFKEAELAGKLSHPSIISIYDVGEDYELTYMAMELLNGKDLEHYCQKDTLLPLRKVLRIVSETAAALDYAHQQGVIHRDIKPANIMVLEEGGIKVTDFGIAKAVSSSQTRTGIILGTPNYMSPEQINGRKIDGRSDIFSLGVVFFQLLTGELPFKGKTLTELFYQITQAKHPSPKEINPKVIRPCVQLIDRALAKDPSERFQDAAEFARYANLLTQKIEQLRAKRHQP
ncbi:MAG: CHASE2 domain-containing protein [Deltaproteobacteria bacterium]|nr:CHASE2 domain-containing protein [Deltaproteobacteria bacterium]